MRHGIVDTARATAEGSRRRWPAGPPALALGVLAAACVLLLLAAGPAAADFGDGVRIHNFEAYPTNTQAGGHPDLVVNYAVDTRVRAPLDHPCRCNDVKDVIVDLPAGVIGNPHAYPQCSAASFAINDCPVDAQVGAVRPNADGNALTSAVFNLTPQPDQAGLLAFKTPIFDTPVYEEITARTSDDYGLRVITRNIQRLITIPELQQTIWGVPSDPKNDPVPQPGEDLFNTAPQLVQSDGSLVGRFFQGYIGLGSRVGEKSNWPRRPFMQNPTTCGEPLVSTLRIVAYDGGVTTATAPWPATTGCGQLSFSPSLAAQPTTSQADSPAGVDLQITVPQFQSPTVPSPSQIRSATLRLPDGFTVNPNAADGKTACTDEQARFGTLLEAQCPEYAKIGTLEVHSAVLPGVLPGALYLGEPRPGNRYRLFLVADGFGVHVKLPGVALLDRRSGRITVSFDDLPQTPFEEFKMHIFGAERGILSTPTKCGRYAVETDFIPWNDDLPAQSATQFFEITSGPGGSPCPAASRPFEPGFGAASADNNAGAYSSYGVDLSRRDGDQFLTGLEVATPVGFSGKLAGIPYCPEAAIATVSDPLYSGLAELGGSSCPEASRVGSVVAGAGAGSRPLYQGGKVYLAGPYRGSPLSLLVVIPAVSGPYDLGNIAVRVAIDVDPTTGRVSTVSDPLPQIVEGVPLRTRLIRVDIDRPNFALNPTNCARLSSDARILGDEGGVSVRRAHYQAANCGKLDFAPDLVIRLRGSGRRNSHPALNAVMTAGAREANIARAAVTLPPTTLLDQSHIRTVCTRVQFAARQCPKAAVYGRAVAHTPLLAEPLRGLVYLRSSDNPLPDLVADLRGQVDFTLVARVDSVRGGLRTTFAPVPDVPVSKFVLRMQGGKKGLIVNSEDLCRRPARARSVMRGQNGRRSVTHPKLRVRCGKSKAGRSSHRRARRAGLSVSGKAVR